MNVWQFCIRTCVSECEISGCVGPLCFPQCNSSSDGGPWYIQEPLYLQWKKWGCQGDCRYQCMVNRESERETLGQAPVKYHGKWPFKRVLGIQVSFFLQSLFFLFWLFPYNMSFDLPCSLPGACFCCFLCTQPSNAFPWLAFLFHHDLL